MLFLNINLAFVSFPDKIEQLVRGFAADWKQAIETINQDVMRSFSNFKTGTNILQVMLFPQFRSLEKSYSCIDFIRES